MVVRAEVCLVSAQKGIDAGLINPNIQIFLIILIITTSFVVPLILKAAYKKDMQPEIDLLNATPEETKAKDSELETEIEIDTGLDKKEA